MNINSLEKIARTAVKGGDVTRKGEKMFDDGLLSAAEHRSVSSLSWQIAANVRASGNPEGTLSFGNIGVDRTWF